MISVKRRLRIRPLVSNTAIWTNLIETSVLPDIPPEECIMEEQRDRAASIIIMSIEKRFPRGGR